MKFNIIGKQSFTYLRWIQIIILSDKNKGCIRRFFAWRSSMSVEVMRKSSDINSPIVAQSQKVKLGLNFLALKLLEVAKTINDLLIIHWCAKKRHLCKKKDTCSNKKKTPVAKKCHPQKNNSHNLKLYDFYFNMIHFIFNFYNQI